MTPFWAGFLIGMMVGGMVAFLLVALMLMQDRPTRQDDDEQVDELRKWVERQ